MLNAMCRMQSTLREKILKTRTIKSAETSHNDVIKASTSTQSGTPSTVEQNCQEKGNRSALPMVARTYFCFDQPTIFSNSRQTYLGIKDFCSVPKQCRDNHPCKLHIAFHGCEQGYDFPDSTKAVYSSAGLILLKTSVSTGGPTLTISSFFILARTANYWLSTPKAAGISGVYTTNALYPTQQGRQISAVWEMVERSSQISRSNHDSSAALWS